MDYVNLRFDSNLLDEQQLPTGLSWNTTESEIPSNHLVPIVTPVSPSAPLVTSNGRLGFNLLVLVGLVHALFLVLLNQYETALVITPPAKEPKIQAYMYTPDPPKVENIIEPDVSVTDHKSEVEIIEVTEEAISVNQITTQAVNNKIQTTTKSKTVGEAKIELTENLSLKTVNTEQVNTQNKTSKPGIKSYQLMDQLRERVYQDAKSQGAIEYAADMQAAKNTIPRSTGKYFAGDDEIAEIKLKKAQVDCKNQAGKAVVMLGKLLGGRIECESLKGLKEFLEKRNADRNNP